MCVGFHCACFLFINLKLFSISNLEDEEHYEILTYVHQLSSVQFCAFYAINISERAGCLTGKFYTSVPINKANNN